MNFQDGPSKSTEDHQDPACGRTEAPFYNFVKPHVGLEGQTPAQVAGVGVQGNKWLTLMKQALTDRSKHEN